MTITITTPTCIECGKKSELEVDEFAYHRWMRGELIQNAFPNLTNEEREHIKTGIHPDCWNKIFPPEEEE